MAGATGVTAKGPWFGLFLPQIRMKFDVILARAQAAEAVGFDSVWLIDHLATPMGPKLDLLEAWTTAAALAVRTESIRIGHMVTCDPFRHPALLAKMVATVDVLSDGRLDLGIGWGSVEAELRRFGIGDHPPAVRAARLRETLEVLALMLTGDEFDYEGRHHRLVGAMGRPVPVQDHVPVHLGGAGPTLTMPLVRDFADWWNCPAYGVERLDELRELAGSARVSVQHPVGLAASSAKRAETVALAERRFGGWGGMVVGTSEEVAARLAGEVERGVEGFLLQFHDFGQPETTARFMEEVAPAVRAAAS